MSHPYELYEIVYNTETEQEGTVLDRAEDEDGPGPVLVEISGFEKGEVWELCDIQHTGRYATPPQHETSSDIPPANTAYHNVEVEQQQAAELSLSREAYIIIRRMSDTIERQGRTITALLDGNPALARRIMNNLEG